MINRLLLPLALLLIASPAAAADKAEVKAMFKDIVARGAAFDPSIADLYSDEATVKTRRIAPDGTERMVELRGVDWKPLIRKMMPAAKEAGDVSSFGKPKVRAEGKTGHWKVSAVRTSALKCYSDDSYYLVVARSGAGTWQIVEESSKTSALSQCPKDPAELKRLLQAEQAALLPHLPVAVDAETTLKAVDIDDKTLIYRYQLINYDAAMLDLATMGPMLAEVAITQSCGITKLRSILAQGGVIRFEYKTRDDQLAAPPEVAEPSCP